MNRQNVCVPNQRIRSSDLSLLFLCSCTSASSTRRCSIRFSHITLFTYYNFRSPSPIASLRQQLCSDSSVGSSIPDDSLSNSSYVMLIHPCLCSSSISPFILSKTYLAEPIDHSIYSELLVAPEEKSQYSSYGCNECLYKLSSPSFLYSGPKWWTSLVRLND